MTHPLVSPYRGAAKGEYDAGDFRHMVRANCDRIRHEDLRLLADQVWDGAGAEIGQFLEIPVRDGPFPI